MSEQESSVAEVEGKEGFEVGKLNAAHMEEQIRALKLGQHIKQKTAEGRARDLISYFRRTTPAEQLYPCSECGAASPATLDKCPYCAFAGDVEDPQQGEESRTGVTRTLVALPMPPPSKPSMLSGRASESNLDACVKRIFTLKSAGSVAAWAIGNELNKLCDGSLWMLRLNDVGTKQKWRNFEAFCHAELAMSPANAKELMRVARHYSQAQVAEFGTKKMLLALQAPPEDRKRIEDEIKKGISKRETEKLVRQANEKRETQHNPMTGKDQKKGSKAKPEEERVDTGDSEKKRATAVQKVTVANIVGVQRVKLFKKATLDVKDPDPKSATRAKKVNDSPTGWLDLANGVRMWFTLAQSPGGELELRVNTKRVEDG